MSRRTPDEPTGPAGKPTAPTVYDVARAAEVSVATVSRAFSRPERVNARTREHVLRVASEIGYQLDSATRALAASRKDAIAVIVSDIANPYFFGVIRGAGRQAAAANYSMVLGESDNEADTETTLIRRLRSTVDGFVLAASRMPNDELRDLARTIPVVLIDRELPGLPSVIIEHDSGTRQIVEHLASLGHQSIAFLAGPKNSWSAAQRWRSLDAAAKHLGLPATRLGPFTPTIQGGAAAADAALVSKATAIVAFNDLLALGVIQRLTERGIKIPDQLSVVGYDNIFGSDFSNPPLTTLGGPTDKGGRAAVELVLRMIREPGRPTSDTRLVVPSQLTIRASSGPSPAAW